MELNAKIYIYTDICTHISIIKYRGHVKKEKSRRRMLVKNFTENSVENANLCRSLAPKKKERKILKNFEKFSLIRCFDDPLLKYKVMGDEDYCC